MPNIYLLKLNFNDPDFSIIKNIRRTVFTDEIGICKSEVVDNYECGICVDGFYEFIEKDIIEVYEIKEIKRKLK